MHQWVLKELGNVIQSEATLTNLCKVVMTEASSEN